MHTWIRVYSEYFHRCSTFTQNWKTIIYAGYCLYISLYYTQGLLQEYKLIDKRCSHVPPLTENINLIFDYIEHFAIYWWCRHIIPKCEQCSFWKNTESCVIKYSENSLASLRQHPYQMNHKHVVSVQTSLVVRHTHSHYTRTHTHTQKERNASICNSVPPIHLSARRNLHDKNTTGNCHIFFLSENSKASC